MSLRISILTIVSVCGLFFINALFCLPIQADEKGIILAEGTGESVIFTLAIKEASCKTADVNELNNNHGVNDVEQDSGVVVEIPTQEIPKRPDLESGYWRIVGIIIGVCSLLIVVVIYLYYYAIHIILKSVIQLFIGQYQKTIEEE